jgi:hypothetical protein
VGFRAKDDQALTADLPPAVMLAAHLHHGAIMRIHVLFIARPRVAVAALLLFLAGCLDVDAPLVSPEQVASVAIHKVGSSLSGPIIGPSDTLGVPPGDSWTVQAVMYDADGRRVYLKQHSDPVRWHAADPSIVGIDTTGQRMDVRGLRDGVTSLSVAIGDARATITVRVCCSRTQLDVLDPERRTLISN